MKKLFGLLASGAFSLAGACHFAEPAYADQSLHLSFPATDYQTTAERIFFLGTAPAAGKVLINGKTINRSPAGHFAPSLPLHLGDNLFTLQYQNEQVQIKVKRLSTQPEPAVGLAFGQNSLTPASDIARLPNEEICFTAIAPPSATVTVQLGNQSIPLLPQVQSIQLPANSAALTGQNQPQVAVLPTEQYQGCTAFSRASALGQPLFQLALNGKTTTQTAPGKIQVLSAAQLQAVEVTADAGIARSGPSTDYSRLTPLPKGTQARVTGREGGWLRLDYGGWINSKETKILPGTIPPRSLIRSIRARQTPNATEVVFPLQIPVPISVQQGDRTFTLTLYNTTAQTDIIHLDDDPLISRLDWQQVAPGQVQYTFNLKPQQQWGYKLRYDGTSLVLTLRHPPRVRSAGFGVRSSEFGVQSQKSSEFGVRGAEFGVQSQKSTVPLSRQHSKFKIQNSKLKTQNSFQSLSGIKILLDPGHGGPDSGTQGPTSYSEKTVTLIMAKLVRDQLASRGATVYMTREDDKDVSLQDRVAMINNLEPTIAVSLHYNSLPDEGDAEHTQGFGAFWYNAQAHSLAVFIHHYIVNKLGRPSYGIFWDNLALTRPTSAPSILLELGFMSNPVEFEWIINPQEQKKLAAAIAEGISAWIRSSY